MLLVADLRNRMSLIAHIVLSLCIAVGAANAAEIYEPDVKPVIPTSEFKVGETTEAPMFDNDGNFYMAVFGMYPRHGSMSGRIVQVDLEKKQLLGSVVQLNISSVLGISAGGQCDRDGKLWVMDATHGLVVATPGGGYKQVTRVDSKNRTIQGFNDGAFDFQGNFWATAPFGEIAPAAYRSGLTEEDRVNGSIYCYNRSTNEMIRIDTGYHFCNGIGVQHTKDGKPKTLLVAETFTRKIWSYDILGPCQVRNRKLWGTSPANWDYWGGFDGIKFDSQGNLLATNFGKGYIDVFGPDGGEPHTLIKLPVKNNTNIAFKPNSKQAYVTAGPASLWTFEWKYKGRTEYTQRASDGSSVQANFVMMAVFLILVF